MCLALGIKRQLIAAVACALATLVGGMINGWPAPTLKKLRQPGSPIHLTTEQETWLVTALHVGTLLSPFPAGFMMNKLGRKASLLALGVLPVISFGLIYLSTTPEMLILARLFAGLWDILSGISCMKAFSSVVLPAHLGPLTSDHCTLIVSLVWMASSMVCTALIDKTGRKPLLYISSFGVAVSMFWTGMWYFLSSQTHIDVSSFSWLPLAGFLVYGCAFSIGWAPITHTFQGELFPSHLKEQASAMTTIVTALTASFSTFVFGMVTKRVGVYANFLWFSVVGVVNLIFVYVYVIETKGRTLEEIQAELKGKKREEPVVRASADSIS